MPRWRSRVWAEPRYLRAAQVAVRLFYPAMLRQPGGYSTLCTALEEVLEPTRVNVLRGPRDALRAWQRTLSRQYLPDAMMFALDSTQSDLPGALNKPAGKTVNAYLCRGVTCQAPIADLEALLANVRAGPAT